GPATGTGVDARLVDADVVVVVNVGDATAQERRAGVDVLVQVVVERDETVREVALAGPDEPTPARVAQDAVGQGHVLRVVLQVEQAVESLRLAARRLQRDVLNPDVANVGLHADGITTVGGRRARLLDVPHGHVLDDDVAGFADVDADLVEDSTATDADDRDVADLLQLDLVVGGVATRAGHLAGVAVVDGPLDLDDDRGTTAGPIAQRRMDLGPSRRPYRLPPRTAGGPTVKGCKASNTAGRCRHFGHRHHRSGRTCYDRRCQRGIEPH